MKKVLLYGAGTLGKIVSEELNGKYDLIGFCDSDLTRKGELFCGKVVYGNIEILPNLNFDVLIITSFPGKNEIERYINDNYSHFKNVQFYFAELDRNIMRVQYYFCNLALEMKRELLVSFSQDYEDIALYHLLSKVREPIRYIDIGANHPIIDSVTRFFYLRDGRGINIEPQVRYLELLKDDRCNDINVGVGIGSKNEILTLYGRGGLATFDYDSALVDIKIKSEVKVVTLDYIIKKYKMSLIHFLKIDCEGWERECILGANLKKNRPWIICIESTLPCTSEACHEKWEYLLLDCNYIFIGQIGVNRFYSAKEYLNELNVFLGKSELENKYFVVKNNDVINIRKKVIL